MLLILTAACKEPGELSQYSNWLQAGSRNWGFNSGERYDIFLFSSLSRPDLGIQVILHLLPQ
jgi:hypothetical protein